MPDCRVLIDDEIWAFIDRSNSFYPEDAVERTVQDQRRTYDRMCKAFHAGYPHGVTAHDKVIETASCAIPIRIYRCAEPSGDAVVLYLHGGGFILGGLDSHDDVCAEICDQTGYEVVSVDYRLVPEHIHPAAFDDALAAYQWAASTYEAPIVLAGDSAGGNLAAAVAHATRRSEKPPIGQVLIYPSLGGQLGQGSYLEHANAPLLSVRDMDYYRQMRAGGHDVDADPTFAPLTDTDYAGLPPTVSSAEWNETRFKRPEFDAMVLSARAELDDAKRKAIYRDMALMVRDEGGAIIPVFNDWVDAVSDTVGGYKAHPAGELYGRAPIECWLQE